MTAFLERPVPARSPLGSGYATRPSGPLTDKERLDAGRFILEFLAIIPQREIRERIAYLWGVTEFQRREPPPEIVADPSPGRRWLA